MNTTVNRRALEAVDPQLAAEFPFDCDTMEVVAEALVAARAKLTTTRELLAVIVDAWNRGYMSIDGLVPWGVVLSLHQWRNVAREALEEKDGGA